MRKRVVIESPFAALGPERAIAYARACLLDSVRRGEAPIASHLLYTQILDDSVHDEREAGIACGFAWNTQAELVAVYGDHGLSSGMRRGVELAESLGIPVVERRIL